MVSEVSHLYGLLALLDPPLGRAPLVLEPYRGPARRLQVVTINFTRGNNSRNGTPPSQPPDVLYVKWLPGRGSPCGRPGPCGSVFC